MNYYKNYYFNYYDIFFRQTKEYLNISVMQKTSEINNL